VDSYKYFRFFISVVVSNDITRVSKPRLFTASLLNY